MNKCTVCLTEQTPKWYSGPKCEACYRKEWYELNKNSKHQIKRKKKYYKDNQKRIILYRKAYVIKNKEKVIASGKQWYANNKNKRKKSKRDIEKRKKWYRNKYKNDPLFKISINLRNRLNRAIENKQRKGSAVRDLGCSITELIIYLQSKFQPGMSWDNYGLHGWHIDHIRPLSSFQLDNPEQFKQACHYTNLQPLWAKDNLTKSDNI